VTFYAELRPINDNCVLEAMNVVDRALADFKKVGREPREAMNSFRDWLDTVTGRANPVFVGFNGTFDWAFVNFYLQHYLKENPFGFGGIDIKSYYMGMIGCSWDETRSSKIAFDFKDPSPHTHNALDDAIEQDRNISTNERTGTGQRIGLFHVVGFSIRLQLPGQPNQR